MKTICRRLRRGDDLLRSIEQIAREEGLEAAVIVSGVGCVSHARVRDASGVTVREIGEPCEIVSLDGTVSAARCHVHIALAREDLSTLGGHLMPGCIVNTTCELRCWRWTAGASAWSRTARRAMTRLCSGRRRDEKHDALLH